MLFQKNLLKILLERLVFYKLLVNFFPQAIWAKSQNKVSGTILSPVLLKGHMGQFAFHVFLCAIFSNPSHGLSGPFGFFAHPQWAPKKMPKKKLAQHGFYRLLFTGPSKGNLGLYGFLSMWNKPQKKCQKKNWPNMVFISFWSQTLPKATWAYVVFCPCGSTPPKKC